MAVPLIAITTDIIDRNGRETAICTTAYADAVWAGGGQPVLLVPGAGKPRDIAKRFDGFVFTGGDDPVMELFGVETDPRVTPVNHRRQTFETALLEELLEKQPNKPLLGVCLGMQLMALMRGGGLDQYMPETHEGHAGHWDADHAIETADAEVLKAGVVHSRHKQAVSDPGDLTVLASSEDGVVEAVYDPELPFCMGVQWHPERTVDAALGEGLFKRLVKAAKSKS
ncbi:MAG: gamma-glutamyl-gamma-aminobutyrate hydrolase family protein [Phycisphaerales bacterium]